MLHRKLGCRALVGTTGTAVCINPVVIVIFVRLSIKRRWRGADRVVSVETLFFGLEEALQMS